MFSPNVGKTHSPVVSSTSRPRSTTAFRSTLRRSQLSGSRTLLPRRSHLLQRSSPVDVSPSLPTVFNTGIHTIANAGYSLPVLVNEEVKLAAKSAPMSVKIGENGWAWLVCARKLFIWKLKTAALSKTALCKELALPAFEQSESMHIADLIHVGNAGSSSDREIVNVLIVTPDGSIRFWLDIHGMSSVIETTLDEVYNGSIQEKCFKLAAIHSGGYLVGASGGGLFHLVPESNTVTCTRLQLSHGMLAGIGRRVSSFFFSSTQQVDLINFIVLHTPTWTPPEVVLLTKTALQKWRLGSVVPECGIDHIIFQIDLVTLLIEPISNIVWGKPATDFKMWPLDIAQASEHEHIALLVAIADMGSGTGRDVIIHFAVCVFPPSMSESGPTRDTVEVVLFDHSEVLQNEENCMSFEYNLIIPDISSSYPDHAVLWRHDTILIKSVAKESLQPEDGVVIDLTGDRVLGGGTYNQHCVLLARNNGFLMVNTSTSSQSHVSRSIEDSILNFTSSSSRQALLVNTPQDPIISKGKMEQLESSENDAQRLQAAFIHFNRVNITQAKCIVNDTFPSDGSGGNLDGAAIFVSQQLIDDYPAQDPRWAESVPQDAGGSSDSLILLHQLEDKQKAHQLYMSFLTEIGIWDDLSMAKDNERKIYTQWALVEHGEKLAATIALRQKHCEHQGVVDAAIRRVLERRNKICDVGLAPQDVFYREVSGIQDIVGCLMDVEEEMIGNSTLTSREMFTAVAGVNDIFEGMLESAHQYRKSKGIPSQDNGCVEFIPWTVSSGAHMIREMVLKQHKFTVMRGLPEAEDGQERAMLHSHLVALTGLILDGYKQQMDSVKGIPARRDEINTAYKRHRTGLLCTLLDVGLVDGAALLAEKYLDFGTLVKVCDRNNDQDRLSKYMSNFSAHGFSDFLFNWYLEHGNYQKLLECISSNSLTLADDNGKLSEFLSSHPRIAWLHQIRTGNFASAHDTLRYLALTDTQGATKKKNLLSISKLAAIFSYENEAAIEEKVEDINIQHTLLRYQETLPCQVLEKLELTVESMPVFSVHKLIELYVSQDNTNSNEVDFKKALDLLQFLPPPCDNNSNNANDEVWESLPNAEQTKLFIWCQAITKDCWSNINYGSNPIETCKHTILARTLNLVCESGMLEESLPNVEKLLEHKELGTVRECATSQYLIRAQFEHVQRMIRLSHYQK